MGIVRKVTIKIGNMLTDALIEATEQAYEQAAYDLNAELAKYRDSLFTTHISYTPFTEYGRSPLEDYMEKHPTWNPATIVEGSVAEVIDDPARLIEESRSTQRNKPPDKT